MLTAMREPAYSKTLKIQFNDPLRKQIKCVCMSGQKIPREEVRPVKKIFPQSSQTENINLILNLEILPIYLYMLIPPAPFIVNFV